VWCCPSGYLGCYVEPVESTVQRQCGNGNIASVLSLLEKSPSMTVARCNSLGLLDSYRYVALQVSLGYQRQASITSGAASVHHAMLFFLR
jgi:hypothetical protein